jgi:Myb/SANT-like DNA-binding domain
VPIAGPGYVLVWIAYIWLLTIYSQLKKEFNIVKKLRESSGFGWDSLKNIVTATADVWERYINMSCNSYPNAILLLKVELEVPQKSSYLEN